MPAIQLEQFSPRETVIQTQPPLDPEAVETIRREAYEQGIKDGAAAASDAFSVEQSQCIARIHELIGDAFLTREEAHRSALSSFQPLISSIVETLVPELLHSGLAAEISVKVEQAVLGFPDDAVNVFVSADMQNDIKQMLGNKGHQVKVNADAKLPDDQAKIEWGSGFDHIDLGSVALNIRTTIDEFFDELKPVTDKVQHGN